MSNLSKNTTNTGLLIGEQALWNYLSISEPTFDTAYEYLRTIISALKRDTTRADLWMDMSSDKASATSSQKRKIIFYVLEIVTPRLTKPRNELLRIAEFEDTGYFPVNIVCNLDSSVIKNVNKSDLHLATMEILARSHLKREVEKLYRQTIRIQGMTTNK